VGAALLSLVGVAAAWLWLNASPWLPVALTLVAIAVGWISARRGGAKLPDHPVAAVSLFEWWILAPASVAVFGAAALVVLALLLARDTWSDENKQLIAAAGAALTTFISTTMTKSAEEGFGGLGVGDKVRSAFQAAYKDRFPSNSPGSNYVYSDGYAGVIGWGRAERKKRAAGVAEALKRS